MRRAGARGRRLPAEADHARLPRRRLRTGRRPGRGEEARLEIGGEARRRAASDARHADRGKAPLALRIQLSDGARPHSRRLRSAAGARLDRHLHRHLPPGRDDGNASARRYPAHRAARADRARYAFPRRGAEARLRRARSCRRAPARCALRQRQRRGPHRPLLRGDHAGRLRRLLPRRDRRCCRSRRLCREDADLRAPAARPARAPERRLDPLHRSGNPRQSGAGENAVGRTQRLAPEGDRPHRDRWRRASARRTPDVAADRSGSDCRAPGFDRLPPGRRPACRPPARCPEARAGHAACALASGARSGWPA